MNATLIMRESFYNSSIDEQKSVLSPRSRNGLMRVKVKTMGDLYENWETIKAGKVRNVGTTSIREIGNFFINNFICQATDEELVVFFDSLIKNCNEQEYATLMCHLCDLELKSREEK